MCIRIDSNDINLLIYYYLQERGLHHTAFGFQAESQLSPHPLKPGSLISYLRKSLQMEELQNHLNDRVPPKQAYLSQGLPLCTNEFALLKPHKCKYTQSPLALSGPGFTELLGHSDMINSLIYYNYLYSCSNDGNICIWSEETCKYILPHIAFPDQKVPVLHFTVFSEKVASYASDEKIRVFNEGKLENTFEFKAVTSMSWSPDGSRLAVLSDSVSFLCDGEWERLNDFTDVVIFLWKTSNEFTVVTNQAVWLCGPEQKQCAIGESCSVAKWNNRKTVLGMVCSNRLGLYIDIQDIWWVSGKVALFDFAPTDRLMVTGGCLGEIQFWDLNCRVILKSFQGHAGKVLEILHRFDGEFVATSGADGILHIWNTEECLKTKSFLVEDVSDIKWCQFGQRLALAKYDKVIIAEIK